MDAQAGQESEDGSLGGPLEGRPTSPAAAAGPPQFRPGSPAIAADPPSFRCPVDLSTVDVDEAVAIARQAIEAAAGVVGGVDAYILQQLVEQVVMKVHSGNAAEDGVCVKEVAGAARVGTGHLPDHYTPESEIVADRAVRLILLSGRRRVLHEEIFTIAARSRRTQKNGYGAYHVKQAPSVIHFVGNAIGASDRYNISWAEPLVTGTPDDPSAAIADAARIADAAAARGRPVPATLADHVQQVLNFQRDLRKLVVEQAGPFGEALRQVSLEPTRAVVGRAFARPVVVRAMPVGPPLGRGVPSASVALPGNDATIVEVLRRSGRPAIAYAGPLGGGDDVSALRARGYTQMPWAVGELARPLAVPEDPPFGCELLWSDAEQTLVRRIVGAGAWAAGWKVVGFPADGMPDAIALVERASESWPRGCLERATRAGAPGLLQGSTLPSQNTWRALLRVADAALVEAERRERARQARG